MHRDGRKRSNENDTIRNGNAKCRTRRIVVTRARAQAHGDGEINYSAAFTLACNGILMHIGTALSRVCARAPWIRLRCFTSDVVDPLTRERARAHVSAMQREFPKIFEVHPRFTGIGNASVLIFPCSPVLSCQVSRFLLLDNQSLRFIIEQEMMAAWMRF